MVHVISKHDGPRREDVAIKRFLQENRNTIGQIKQALTGAGLTTPRPAVETPSPEATRAFGYRRTADVRDASPYLRISPNGRVVVADYDTGRQIHHLGDLRGVGAARRFVLATKGNGYFAPLDPEVAAPLVPVDNHATPDAEAEAALKHRLGELLGFAS